MAEKTPHGDTRRLETSGGRAPQRHLRTNRRIAMVMGLVAASLAVMSGVHLAGLLQGSSPFRPDGAGIAEAIICVAMLVGALALWRTTAHHWGVAVATTGFAIAGFVVGLTFTLRGGEAIDIAYHGTVLPLLLLTLLWLLRTRDPAP
jgi:hypothetical protein